MSFGTASCAFQFPAKQRKPHAPSSGNDNVVDESKQPVAASPPAGLRNPVNPYRKSTPVKPLQNIVDDRKPEGTRRAVSAFPKPAASSVPSSPALLKHSDPSQHSRTVPAMTTQTYGGSTTRLSSYWCLCSTILRYASAPRSLSVPWVLTFFFV